MLTFSTSTSSSAGIQNLASSTATVNKVEYYNILQMSFSNPSSIFNAFSHSGVFYVSGEADLSHAKASWVIESQHSTATNERSTVDAFPDSIFICLSDVELTILDAVTKDVWMRFTFGGDFLPSTGVNDFDFNDGILLIGTDDGLRVADFREDVLVKVTNIKNNSLGPVSGRNGTGLPVTIPYWTGSSTKLQEDKCLKVSISAYQASQVIAIAHESAITGFKISKNYSPLPVADVVFQKYTDFRKNIAVAYTAVGTNNFIETVHVTNWDGLGIRKGDFLLLSGVEYKTTSIQATRIIVDAIIPAHTGGSYTVIRKSEAIQTSGKDLYLSNGQNKITRLPHWWDSSTVFNPFTHAQSTSEMSQTSRIHSLHVTSNEVYLGSVNGVWRVSQDELTSSLSATHLYGGPGSQAKYEILKSGGVIALSIDIETGHLLVATDDPSVEEIDTLVHQSFRVFDSTTNPPVHLPVHHIYSYRDKAVETIGQ